MRILGMISGTSHDGIDHAIVDFSLSASTTDPQAAAQGSRLQGLVEHCGTTAYAPALRARLIAALPPQPTTLAEVCELDTLIGQAFAEVAATAIAEGGPVDLIVSHGQTVFHWVRESEALGTLQIGQPAWIAERTSTPVLSDVRIRDITVGGHGAPLVSYLDALLLAGFEGTSAALNLGGISNMTVRRGPDDLYAYDIGPASALLDAVVVERSGGSASYDVDGLIAATGTVDQRLLEVLLADPYYGLPAPKSTGKEHFHGAYVAEAIASTGSEPTTADLLATLTELTASVVARDVVSAGVSTLVASGGGVRNPVLMERLRRHLGDVRLLFSDELGAPTDDKEAIAFALIGWCTAHGLPGALPQGTGARAPRILGTLTPGAGPLLLPAPLARPPASLSLVWGA